MNTEPAPQQPDRTPAGTPPFDPDARAPNANDPLAGHDDPFVAGGGTPRKVRPAASMLPAGPFDPAGFHDNATSNATGRHRFAVERDALLGAVSAASALAGTSARSKPIGRAVLFDGRVKIAGPGEHGGFVESIVPMQEDTTPPLAGARPIEFHVELPKLAKVARSGKRGEPVRFELDAARRRLLVLGERQFLRLATRDPSEFAQYRRDAGFPAAVGAMDPLLLREALRLVAECVRTEPDPKRAYFSWANLRDGMLFGGHGGAFVLFRADGLQGLEALVHAADVAPVAKLLGGFDRRCTRLFDAGKYWMVADGRMCIGLPKADTPIPMAMVRDLLRHGPVCCTRAAREPLLRRLDRLAAGTMGEPGGGVVRVRLKGVGADAELVLQASDAHRRNRGLAAIECFRMPAAGADGPPPDDVDVAVDLRHLRRAVAHFETPNVDLSAVPSPKGGFAWAALRVSHNEEGECAFSALTFISARAPS